MEEKAEHLLKQAAQRFHLSGRVIHRILKLARTIADIEQAENVEVSHIAEALQFRNRTMFVEKS